MYGILNAARNAALQGFGVMGKDIMTEPLVIKLGSSQPRDIALGQFMNAWSDLEGSLRILLGLLSGASPQVAQAIAAAIPDLGRMRELLMALGAAHLDDAEQKELDELCKYLTISAMYRNSIVHGQWGIVGNTIIDEDGREVMRSEWMRIYVIIDPQRESDAVAGLNTADRERYVFSISRLHERAQKAADFSKKIYAFADKIRTRYWGDRWPPARSFPLPSDKSADRPR